MIHPDTQVFSTGSVGLGIRATRAIPRGTLLWVRDPLDVVLSDDEVSRLAPNLRAQAERLGYRDSAGRWVVCWDGGKYVNHSCAPTMRGIGPDAMIALDDVKAGQEITCDYAECNLDVALPCRCGATSCRRVISSPTPPDLWHVWQTTVVAARDAAIATGVDQPLALACVDKDVWKVLSGALVVPKLQSVERSA